MTSTRFTRRQALTALGATAGLALGAHKAAWAADAPHWPTRPLRFISPYPPGGTADTLCRLFAQKVGEVLSQPIVVENRAGAGGNVGAVSFIKASYDDHSFMMVTQSLLSINQFLYKGRLGYDPVTDLTPVALTGQTTNLIVVPNSLPVHTFPELIAYIKANPGKTSYSSGGVGTTAHLVSELLKTIAHLDVLHVPYKGNGPAMQAVLAGEVQFNIDNITPLAPQVKAGKLRALGVTSSKRWLQLPEVPTVVELGYPDLVTVVWFGLVGQAKMSNDIVVRMNTAVQKALADPQFIAKLRENGLEGMPGTPTRMAEQAAAERVKWKVVVEASGATVD